MSKHYRITPAQTKRCSHCHEYFPATLEYFSSGGKHFQFQSRCRVCQRANAKVWRAAHPEIVRERNKRTPEQKVQYAINRKLKESQDKEHYRIQQRINEMNYRLRHREKIRVVNRTKSQNHRQKHPERASASEKKWRQSNHEKVNSFAKTRRSRKANAPVNDFTHTQWVALQMAFDHRCAYCGIRAKAHLTQDHITPLSKGGSHTLSNIVPACKSCNSKKHTGVPLRPVQPLLVLAGSPVARVARLEYQRVQELS